MRRLVHLRELSDDALDELNRLVRRQAIFPPHLRDIPPPRGTLGRLKDELLAIPNSSDGAFLLCVGLANGEVEFLACIVQDMVDGDEDGCAQLNRLGRFIEGIDGESAATDMIRLFKDGDVDR